MKGFTVFLLTVVAVTVTARHRKEWKRVNPARAAREHFQPIYKYDIPACTRGAGFYRDPQDCHQYIRCVDEFGSGRHFSVFVGRCEPGLVFDENVSACNWPELAAPCTNSPERIQATLDPIPPEIVLQENDIPEETNREKPYPVQQQVIQTPQESDSYDPQQQESWEIQVVHPEEESYPQVQEVTWQQVFQTTEEPDAYDQKQKEIFWQQKPHQDKFQQQGQQQQQSAQYPINHQQNVEQNTEFEEVIEEKNKHDSDSSDKTRRQQQIMDKEPVDGSENSKKNPNGQQETSGIFEEIEENPQSEISANFGQGQQDQYQETQSQWWIPDNSAQHNPPVDGEQIHVTGVSKNPFFCEKEGFFRHPENCSQFIRCVKFENAYSVHFFECPKQLVFNEKDSACIDDEASCRTYIRRKRQAPSAQLECREEGFFRHPHDCRAFYRCVKTESGSYETHLFSCPANLVFDEEYTTCNWPEKAPPCDNKGQQLQKKKKPARTEKPARTTSKGPTQKPRNDFIDKTITQETYKKQRSTAKPRTTPSYESSTKCRSQGFFSNKNDCTKFFKCVKKGNRYVRYDVDCPINFAFDDRSKRCVAKRYVTSCSNNKPYPPPRQDDEETTVSPETTSSEPSSSKSPESSNEDIVCEREGYFRHPEDCNKFYRCVDFNGNGEEFVRYDFDCPEGLIFDETNSVCNWPDPNTPCETRSGNGGTDQGGNGGTGGSESEGAGESGNGGTGESGNEGTGESGNEGTGESGNEGTGEGSDGEAGESETGNESGGEDTGSESGEETSTETSETTSNTSDDGTSEDGGSGNEAGSNQSGSECTKEGFYRNPEDCNKFYRCVDFSGEGKEFVRYDFACPEGLVFDEANSVCNWPSDSEPCDTGSGTGNENEGGQEGPESSTSTTASVDGNESGGGQEETGTTLGETTSEGSSVDNSPETDQNTPDSTTDSSTIDGSSDQQTSSSQYPEATSQPSESGGNSGECTEAGFFRNPEDCNNFYRCVDNDGDGNQFVKYDFTCPEGLVFDETNSVCNWPEQSAPCESGMPGGESTPSEGSDGSDSSPTTDGGEASQTTSSSGESSEITTGASGSSSEETATESTTRKDQSTPSSENEQPGSTTDSSDTSSDGDSGESTSSGGSNENTGECTEEGFFRNPEDCGKFYRCVDFNGDGQQFVRYDFDCPEGLVFDEVNSVCNWPDQSPKCETKGGGSNGRETTTSDEGTSSDSSTTQSTGASEEPSESTSQQSSQATTEQTTEGSSESTSQQSSQATTEQTTEGSSEQPSQTSTQQSTSQGPTTGDSSECSESGFFRCKDDCNKFYRCVDEDGKLVRYDFKCPDGLIFDDQNKKCDWPSNELTCDTDSSTSDGSTDSSQSSTTSGTDSSSSTSDYSTSTTETSTSSSESSKSTPTETSQPSSTTQSSTTSTDTSTSNIECTEEGYFRNPDDCSKYYRCIDEGDGTLTREDFSCAEDEVFDEEMRYCNRKDLAPPCDDSESTSSQSSTTTVSAGSSSESTTEGTTTQSSGEISTSAGDKSECTEPGFFRCPDDCTKFYRCVEESGESENLVRYDFHCPEGLIFDEQNKKCDFPSSELTCDNQAGTSSTQPTTSRSQSTTESSAATSDATSSSDRSTTTATTSSESESSSTEGCTEEGYFRNPEDCRKYYRCLDEGDGTLTREDFECEEDEVFDEEMRYCNRKDLAPPCDETSSSTTESSRGSTDSSSEQSSTTESSSSTTESSGGSTDSSSEQSSTTESSSSTTESPGGSTDSSEQTSSGTSEQQPESTTETSSTSGSESSGECQEEGFHRDPNDCGKFYRCVDFRGDGQSFTRYDFDCPEGLVFDETNDVCNWPSSVPSCESSASGGESDSSTSGDSSSSTASDSSTSTTSGEQTSSTSGDDSSSTSSSDPASQTSSDSEGDTSDGTTSSSSTNDDSTGSGSSTTSSGSTESTRGSSNDIECTEEGYFRHPEDCGKFYRCVDFAGTGESFVRYDFDCPEGLVFDEVNSVCNWPNQSPRCETGSGGSSGGTDSGNSGSNDGDSTDSESSSGSTVSEQTTSRDTSGSTTSESQTTVSSAPGTDATSAAPDEFRCTEEGYFKHPSDCKKYYECKRDEDTGELVRIDCECPDGQVWDNEGWYCNAEELSPPCEENSSSFRCSEEGFFRDPEDCTRYYQCNRTGENEFEYERFQCEEGLVFDEEGRYCNAPELSEPCDESSSSSKGDTSTTERADSGASGSSTSESSTAGSGTSESANSEPSPSNQCTREGFFRNPDDCTKYYQCSKNENTGEFDRTDHSCSDGRIFDEGSNYCNEPELSDEPCDSNNNGGATTVQQSSTDSSSSTSGSGGTRGSGGDPQCTQEGFFRHPDDCNKFYRCVDFSGSGESFVRYDFDCPEGLHFDEVNSVCNWPTMTPPCESGNQLLRRYLGVIN